MSPSALSENLCVTCFLIGKPSCYLLPYRQTFVLHPVSSSSLYVTPCLIGIPLCYFCLLKTLRISCFLIFKSLCYLLPYRKTSGLNPVLSKNLCVTFFLIRKFLCNLLLLLVSHYVTSFRVGKPLCYFLSYKQNSVLPPVLSAYLYVTSCLIANLHVTSCIIGKRLCYLQSYWQTSVLPPILSA